MKYGQQASTLICYCANNLANLIFLMYWRGEIDSKAVKHKKGSLAWERLLYLKPIK